MIKSYIKKSRLWKKISYSDLYQRLRFPGEFKKRQEEPNFYKNFLRNHPAKNNLIFDVGANRGHKSAVFSKLAKKVIAFEPSEKLYVHLKRRFEDTNISLFNYALGSSVFESEIYLVEDNEAYNSLNKKHIETTTTSRGIANLETVKRQDIKVEKLENFIEKFGTPKYIKIDVEGYELEVLKGLKTPVPLLSFEANLPEFCGETIQAIKYLAEISTNRYRFNFANDNYFLKEKFLNKEEAISFIRFTKLRYLEIFVKLIPEDSRSKRTSFFRF